MTTLTIAIPTFNRSYSLDLLLCSICNQFNALDSNDIELIVLDNCSTDDTREIALSRIHGFSNARYICNDSNIGADNNFVSAFSQAHGHYVWIIGDDELIFDGAIKIALDLCETENFGVAYLASVPVPLTHIEKFTEKTVPYEILCLSYCCWQFAKAINYRLTFLSGSIVNKKMVIEGRPHFFEEVERFRGSNLVHLTWVLAAIISSDKSIYVKTPLFASTVANSGGYNPVSVFLNSLGSFFDFFFSGMCADASKFVNDITLVGWFPRVVYDSRFNIKYNESFKFAATDFPDSLRKSFVWRLFALVLNGRRPIAFISMLALKLWHRLYQSSLDSKGRRFYGNITK